jgi:hypothetical protein
MTMNRGSPPHLGLFMGWADGFRPSLLDLMNEPGRTTSDGQSIRATLGFALMNQKIPPRMNRMDAD